MPDGFLPLYAKIYPESIRFLSFFTIKIKKGRIMKPCLYLQYFAVVLLFASESQKPE